MVRWPERWWKRGRETTVDGSSLLNRKDYSGFWCWVRGDTRTWKVCFPETGVSVSRRCDEPSDHSTGPPQKQGLCVYSFDSGSLNFRPKTWTRCHPVSDGGSLDG